MRRLALLIVIVVIAAACGKNNESDETATSLSDDFSLSSGAFGDGELIPDQFALAGENESPPLRWSGAPAGTEELALAVVDPDASNFIHWVVAGIDPAATGVDAGEVPDGAAEALNSFNEPGWSGPAPPEGTRHTYVFTLYALPDPSGVTASMSGGEAIDLIDQQATERAELRGEYEPPS